MILLFFGFVLVSEGRVMRDLLGSILAICSIRLSKFRMDVPWVSNLSFDLMMKAFIKSFKLDWLKCWGRYYYLIWLWKPKGPCPKGLGLFCCHEFKLSLSELKKNLSASDPWSWSNFPLIVPLVEVAYIIYLLICSGGLILISHRSFCVWASNPVWIIISRDLL